MKKLIFVHKFYINYKNNNKIFHSSDDFRLRFHPYTNTINVDYETPINYSLSLSFID